MTGASISAGETIRKRDVDFLTVHALVNEIWHKTRRCILRDVGAKNWGRLTFNEKAFICARAVKAIADKGGLRAFSEAGNKHRV